MIQIGKFNTLRIVKKVDFGIYLDGGSYGEILMPKRYVPIDAMPNDDIDAFIYFDSEDRIIGTTEIPLAQVGEFAFMKCNSVNNVGAFLEWGVNKDLMVPFREQRKDMEEGRWYVVYVLVDPESDRIFASNKIDKYFNTSIPNLDINEQVNLLIYHITELGYKAIINNTYTGILYKDEVFTRLDVGMKCTGFIKKIRPDGKIDLSLQSSGHQKIPDIAQMILEKLTNNNGFLALTDKSEADLIYDQLGISKKTFKKAIGDLYKKRSIQLEVDGIRLVAGKGK
ncbi:MAG: S1-like domain-containing RNA-binding protein [Saprospiraceae bacterium]|nr:GntR family transcriptional regulator [Saprospiraceae bacterium]